MDDPFGRLVGGRLCLDFVNTVRGRVGNPASRGGRDYADRVVGERLVAYDGLLRWGTLAGALTAKDAGALRRVASRRPAEAAEALERALAAREAMYRLFKARIEGWLPRPEDLAALNREIQRTRAHERLVASPRLAWEWDATRESPDSVLWPVIRSAADLLTGPDVDRVRQCPGDECGWLFFDNSRSRRRQWCHMGDCGTLAKVRRFRQRHSGVHG